MTFGKSELTKNTLEWLLNSNPWTKYRVLTDLKEKTLNDPEVMKAKEELLQDPKILELIEKAREWFPYQPKRHDDSKMSHYKLRMLTDFGLSISDPGMEEIENKLKAHKDLDKGLFQIRQEIPEKGAEKEREGKSVWNALPCDSPLLTYILLKLNPDDPDINESLDFFKKSWETTEGWFCNLSFVKGQFKKYNIGCPMFGLMSLEIFSLIPELHDSKYVLNACEPLKFHKELGKSLYYFGRSKKFWSFKYPYVWYNALYIGDILSRFKCFKDNDILKEIISWIEDSFDDEGKITPTSMFREYTAWDFSNKKSPSPWITLMCYKILKRYYE